MILKSRLEREKEERLNANIKTMIRYELKRYEDFVSTNIITNPDNKQFDDFEKSHLIYIDDLNAPDIISKFSSFPRLYDQLSMERKSSVLKGESLPKVEEAYRIFTKFVFKKRNGHIASFTISEAKDLLATIEAAATSPPLKE